MGMAKEYGMAMGMGTGLAPSSRTMVTFFIMPKAMARRSLFSFVIFWTHCSAPFSQHSEEKGTCTCLAKIFAKRGLNMLKIIQLECYRIIHPLVSLTFGGHCSAPFSHHAEEKETCM